MTAKTNTRTPSALDATAGTDALRASALGSYLERDALETVKEVRGAARAFRKVAGSGCAESVLQVAWSALEERWSAGESADRLESLERADSEAQTALEAAKVAAREARKALESAQALQAAIREARRETGLSLLEGGMSQKGVARVLGVTPAAVRKWRQAAEADVTPEGDAPEGGTPDAGTPPTAAEASRAIRAAADLVAGLESPTPAQVKALQTALARLTAQVEALAPAAGEAAA